VGGPRAVGPLRVQSQPAGANSRCRTKIAWHTPRSPILLLELFYSSLFALSQLQIKPVIHKIYSSILRAFLDENQ
jgi:hypothetical protein